MTTTAAGTAATAAVDSAGAAMSNAGAALLAANPVYLLGGLAVLGALIGGAIVSSQDSLPSLLKKADQAEEAWKSVMAEEAETATQVIGKDTRTRTHTHTHAQVSFPFHLRLSYDVPFFVFFYFWSYRVLYTVAKLS